MTPPLHLPTSPIDQLHDAFARAAEQALDADDTLRDRLRSAADADPMPADLLDQLRVLQQARAKAAVALGEAALSWIRAGGELVLQEPDLAAAAVDSSADAVDGTGEELPSEDGLPPHAAPADSRHEAVCPGPDDLPCAGILPPPASDVSDGGSRPSLPDAASPVSDGLSPEPDLHALTVPPAAPSLSPPAPVEPAAGSVERPDTPFLLPMDDEPTDELTPLRADASDIARLIRGFGQTATFSHEPRVAVQTSMPRAIPLRLGAPRTISDGKVWREQLRLLEREVYDVDNWSVLADDARYELLSLLTARARHLQDEVDMPPGQTEGLARVFRSLSRLASERRVGFVNGLSRPQRPAAGSWRADERKWWSKVAGRAGLTAIDTPAELFESLRKALATGIEDEELVRRVEQLVAAGMSSHDTRLVELVVPRMAAFENSTRCKTLKSVLKQRFQEEEDAEAAVDETCTTVPESILAQTRGRSAILVGGDCRNRALARIQEAFQLSEVTWETGHKVRRLDALAKRLKVGGPDIVVILQRFVSHKVTDILLPSIRAREDAKLVFVARGYGVCALVGSFDQ